MKQRIGLAQALVNDPSVVFLDEPTDGVDPQGRRDFREIICAMRNEGRTVFISSHLLGEMEKMADRVAILSHGKVLCRGLVEDLTTENRCFEISHQGALSADCREWCSNQGIVVGDGVLDVKAVHASVMQPVIDRLRAEMVIITSIQDRRTSLEDLFLRAVQGDRLATANDSISQGGEA
jgi:ABC-2 type transport system ATP-binding protein